MSSLNPYILAAEVAYRRERATVVRRRRRSRDVKRNTPRYVRGAE